MAGGPRFRHLDDVPDQEVRRIGYAERTASVRAKARSSTGIRAVQ